MTQARRYPQTLTEEHPGSWGAVNTHRPGRRLEVVRLLLVIARDADPRTAVLCNALVGSPPDRPLLGEGFRFPLPARLFTLGVASFDLRPPRALWEPGESLWVLTSGPVEAMAVLCAPVGTERQPRP